MTASSSSVHSLLSVSTIFGRVSLVQRSFACFFLDLNANDGAVFYSYARMLLLMQALLVKCKRWIAYVFLTKCNKNHEPRTVSCSLFIIRIFAAGLCNKKKTLPSHCECTTLFAWLSFLVSGCFIDRTQVALVVGFIAAAFLLTFLEFIIGKFSRHKKIMTTYCESIFRRKHFTDLFLLIFNEYLHIFAIVLNCCKILKLILWKML